MDQPQYGSPPNQPYGTPPNYPAPGYGQQYQQAPGYAPGAGADKWGPTSVGMSAPLAAGLGYLIAILGIVFFFIEKQNRFLKFHSAQVILLAIVGAALGVAWGIVLGLFGGIATATGSSVFGLITALAGCVVGLAYLGFVGLWIWGMIAAFTGKYTKLPIIGNIAEKWAGGAPAPTL